MFQFGRHVWYFKSDNSDFNNSQLSAVYRRLRAIIGPLSLPFINSIFVTCVAPFAVTADWSSIYIHE